ncbi:hypothetical protein EMPG_09839 [Blastomyces silverae]|uniref:Uncharacterized protein n=1 Tax=Blastomyces silverae TaxID=2060906 RepID=A0A0H1BIP9_9EURO|nr:hypothetical protein EMPG_09839 [Blastomyces silverae]
MEYRPQHRIKGASGEIQFHHVPEDELHRATLTRFVFVTGWPNSDVLSCKLDLGSRDVVRSHYIAAPDEELCGGNASTATQFQNSGLRVGCTCYGCLFARGFDTSTASGTAADICTAVRDIICGSIVVIVSIPAAGVQRIDETKQPVIWVSLSLFGSYEIDSIAEEVQIVTTVLDTIDHDTNVERVKVGDWTGFNQAFAMNFGQLAHAGVVGRRSTMIVPSIQAQTCSKSSKSKSSFLSSRGANASKSSESYVY